MSFICRRDCRIGIDVEGSDPLPDLDDGQNVIIQDGCVKDIGIVANLDKLQEDLFYEQMPGKYSRTKMKKCT